MPGTGGSQAALFTSHICCLLTYSPSGYFYFHYFFWQDSSETLKEFFSISKIRFKTSAPTPWVQETSSRHIWWHHSKQGILNCKQSNAKSVQSSWIFSKCSSPCWISDCILKFILNLWKKRLTHRHPLCVSPVLAFVWSLGDVQQSPFLFCFSQFALCRLEMGNRSKAEWMSCFARSPVLTDFKAGWGCVCVAWLRVCECVCVCNMHVHANLRVCAWVPMCLCAGKFAAVSKFLSVYPAHPWIPESQYTLM